MERVVFRVIISVLVAAVVLVAADRAIAGQTARWTARRLTSVQRLASPATVTFRGVPFVTQAAVGRYRDVEVSMSGVPTEGPLVVDRLDVHLSGVGAPSGPILRGALTQLSVDHGRAEGFVSFAALERAADAMLGSRGMRFTLTRAGDGRVAFAAQITAFIGTVTVRGQTRVAVRQGAVVLGLLPETLVGVPSAWQAQIVPQVDLSHLVPALPFGFQATGVVVDPSGLRLWAAGDGLVIPV